MIDKQQKGFTLVELLIAASMSLIIISLVGVGITNMMAANLRSSRETQSQYDLNLVAELISQEIKSSSEISTQPEIDAKNDWLVTDYANIPADAKYILLLKNNQDLAAPIIYFTVPRNSSSVQESWLVNQGTNLVLYRWGPAKDKNGVYVSPQDPFVWGNPIPVLDLLSSTSIVGKCPDPNWKLIPLSNTTEGFYVCVKPTTTGATSGKLVMLNLTTKVKIDRLSQEENKDTIKYKINTEVYSRVKSK